MTTNVSGPPDLSGQTAVVTGAAGGIGREVCSVLARAGADIIATDLEGSDLQQTVTAVESRGQTCHSVACDITDRAAVAALAEEAFDRNEHIEILVNSHGVVRSRDPFESESYDDWYRTIEINLTGTFLVTKAFYGPMQEEGYGKIVSIGSVAGQTGRSRPSTGYSASKGGIHAFTRTLARQGAPHGVLVNAIAPGPVRTPLTDMGEHIPDDEQPVGRLGEPEDIAEAVLFFASQQSNWTTGTILAVNGGSFIG